MEGHPRDGAQWNHRQQPVSYQDLDSERAQLPRAYHDRHHADGGRVGHYQRPQYHDRIYHESSSYDRHDDYQRRGSGSPDYRSARHYPHDAHSNGPAREHDHHPHEYDTNRRDERYQDRDYHRDSYHHPARRSRSPQWDRDRDWARRPYADHDWRSRDQERDSHSWDPDGNRRDHGVPESRFNSDRDVYDRPRRTPPPPPPPPPGPPPPPSSSRPRYVPAQLRLVKLTSDVLPPQQGVATVESEASGGSAGVEEGISVGRDRVFTRRLRLASMDVSKHHANIFRTAGAPSSLGGDGGWWIVDNGSAHGTYVLGAEKRLDFFHKEERSADKDPRDAMALQQITTGCPPLAIYHRLSEPKTASRPYELRHQDLVRFGATVLEVHLHVAPSRDRNEEGAGDGVDYRAATCCEVCQIDFSGQNLIPLSAKEGAGSASTSNSQTDLASASTGGLGGDTSVASGNEANRSLTGDRKTDSEVEWKRQMKGLRANYLGGPGKSKSQAGGSGGAGSAPSASTVSWQKHLSTKKKRSNADDGVMVSISTAHLERRVTSRQRDEASIGVDAERGDLLHSTPTDDAKAETSAASPILSAPTLQYVDRAAQRRLHAHSIEKTLPRNAVAELAGHHPHRVHPEQALRLASAAMPLPRLGPTEHLTTPTMTTEGGEPVARASASKPLAETNRGFKLLSVMSGGGGSAAAPAAAAAAAADGEDGARGEGSPKGAATGGEQERPERARHADYEPILARGTSGRAGLGSAKLRDVDEIAAAGENSSYADHGRETMRRRWDEAR